MANRSILVPISGNDSDGAALAVAAQIASRFNGHIDGLHVERSVEYQIPSMGGSSSVANVREITQDLQEENTARTKAAHEKFRTWLEERQIPVIEDPPTPQAPTASWQTVSGDMSDEVTVRGRAYDLIVIVHPNATDDEGARKTVEAALFGTGRPVLIASERAPRTVGETVLVGWNRTVQSARAVAGAMPILEGAKRVIVFMVATGAKEGPSPHDIARTLACNDIKAEVKEVSPQGRRVGRILLDEAREAGADLMVMGAYSHSRWREMILGGVTRYVLEHAELPVLMAH